MEKKQLEAAQKQLQGIFGMLSLQFILGVVLTTLIDYNPDKPSAVQVVFLVLHIIVAVGLLVSAVVRLVSSIKWGYQQTISAVGFLAIIDAMVAGIVAAANGDDVAVFMMALGFIVAFSAYGNSIGAITRRMPAAKA